MISQVTWETRVRSIPTKRVGCFHGANAPGIEKSHAFVLIPKDALFHGARFIKSSVFTREQSLTPQGTHNLSISTYLW
jgi:hypothetical protein